MVYRVLADLVLIIHIVFFLFALMGAWGVVQWPRLKRFHVPITLWSMAVLFTGGLDPLNPLEHGLRLKAGIAAQKIGWVEQYLTPLFFPTPLNRRFQIIAGMIILAVNAAIYAWIHWRSKKVGTRWTRKGIWPS
jgi:hypothetical protein